MNHGYTKTDVSAKDIQDAIDEAYPQKPARPPLVALPTVGRTLPHSHDAEERLLAALFIAADELLPLARAAKFTADSFYEPRHGLVFDAMLALADTQKPIAVDTVIERLQETHQLDAAGGYSGLVEVSRAQPTSQQGRFYLDQVRKQWILRQTIRRAQKIMEECYAYDGAPFVEFLAPAAAWFQNAVARARMSDRGLVETAPEAIDRIIGDLKKRAAGQEDRSGWIYTGFPEFDAIESASCMYPFGSAREDHNVIIGGGSSMGKSVLLRQWAGEALGRGQRVLVYTLETSRDGLLEAFGASRARVNLRALDRLPGDHLARMETQFRELSALADKRLFVFERKDDPAFDCIEGIVAHAESWCAMHGTPHLIVLDYLQLVGTKKRCNSREQEVATVSHAWQALQRRLGCVTLAGAQLNEQALAAARQVKHDKEGKIIHELPNRGALRESQALYHDADIVIFLHLPVVDRTGRDQVSSEVTRPEMWLHVDKRRSGVRGRAAAWFDKQYRCFLPIHGAGTPAPAAPPTVRTPAFGQPRY